MYVCGLEDLFYFDWSIQWEDSPSFHNALMSGFGHQSDNYIYKFQEIIEVKRGQSIVVIHAAAVTMANAHIIVHQWRRQPKKSGGSEQFFFAGEQ